MSRMILKGLIVNRDHVNPRLVVKQYSSFFFNGVMISGYFGESPAKEVTYFSAYRKVTHYFTHNMHPQELNWM